MFAISRRGFLSAAAAAVRAPLARGQAHLRFLRTPNVQNLTGHQATIFWTWPELRSGALRLRGPDGELHLVPATVERFEPALTGLDHTYFQYRATATGLRRGARYGYEVLADGEPLASPLGGPLEFATPGDGDFRFLHFADSGEGNAPQLELAAQMLGEAPQLVLANGDLAYDHATFASVEANYYGVYRELMARVPFFTTLGNHEYYALQGLPSLAGRAFPDAGAGAEHGRYYSFDWGNAHFVALDTNEPLARAAAGASPMLRWLEEDLRRTRQFWRIAFFHHPGFATGKHMASAEAERVRNLLAPVLETHGVQLVLNGHEHTYQRSYELRGGDPVPPNSGGTVYVTSGGGGAQTHWFAPNHWVARSVAANHYLVVDVRPAAISVRARGLGPESDIDGFELRPPPRLESVVNAASFTGEIAAGSIASVFGYNLCPHVFAGEARQAHGCSVRVNGDPLLLLYADARQINVQMPDGLTGEVALEVRTPNGAAGLTLRLLAAAPALFAHPAHPDAALAVSGGALVEERSPAARGRPVSLFATGLGAATAPARVRIRGLETDLIGPPRILRPGVWQIDALVPANLPRGAAAVQLLWGGLLSNTLTLPVT
jgi:uncharacterized protein (TIGR03437 family)